MNINRPVLLLNACWQAIDTITLKKAMEDMNSSRTPKLALKIEYQRTDNGFDFTKPTEIIPLKWGEWITLSSREYDEDCIRTPNLEIRIPTVLIAPKYQKIPKKTFRPTKRNLYDKYGGKCVWTGEQISYSSASIEHMTPKSRGGKNTWENLAIASPKMNHKKADRTVEEFGIEPKYKLVSPKPVPVSVLIRAINPDWAIFVDDNK